MIKQCVLSMLGVGDVRETIVVVGRRAVPLGVINMGRFILLKPFFESKIGWELLRLGEAFINVVDDSLIFYKVLIGELQPEERSVSGASGLIVARVADAIVARPRLKVFMQPIECITEGCEPRAYSRANALLMEILIRYTRVNTFIAKGRGDAALRMFAEAESFDAIIERVAPGTEYSRASKRLVGEMKKLVNMLTG